MSNNTDQSSITFDNIVVFPSVKIATTFNQTVAEKSVEEKEDRISKIKSYKMNPRSALYCRIQRS